MSLHKTAQFFITNRCNKRCKGCFYASQLSNNDMDIGLYKSRIVEYQEKFGTSKVILLGGEPTLHPQVQDFVDFALERNLCVTIYTNGAKLEALSPRPNLTVRIGVLGYKSGEKALAEIKAPSYPVAIVYMLRKDNLHELDATASDAGSRFNCQYFMLSSIRDIAQTGDYWKDTEETLSNDEYRAEVLKFLDRYKGPLDVHVANRGVFQGCGHNTCRFINVFPDGSCTLCPFDISLGRKDEPSSLGRRCNKNSECLLQKFVRPHLT